MKPFSLVLLVSLAAMIGCNQGPKLVAVEGTVTVKGKPAEGAMIMFHPADPKQATASGVAEADGKFKIMSNGEVGILTGKYEVTLTWPDPTKKPTQAQIMMGTAELGPDLLKGAYATKGTSKLTAEITSSTKQLPPFEL